MFKDQGIISGHRHVEISSWFGELESTFYKHPKLQHLDVFRVSDDPNEGCTGIFMSSVCVIGNRKTKSERFKVLIGPVGKQVTLLWKNLLLPHSSYKLCFYCGNFDRDDVGIVCCDEIIGWIIEQSRCNSQQQQETFLSLKHLDYFWDAPSHTINRCRESVPKFKNAKA